MDQGQNGSSGSNCERAKVDFQGDPAEASRDSQCGNLIKSGVKPGNNCGSAVIMPFSVMSKEKYSSSMARASTRVEQIRCKQLEFSQTVTSASPERS